MRHAINAVAATCGSVLLFLLAPLAHAGPTDTPLPNFSDGKPAQHVYTAVGVIKNNNLETVFVCTNLGTAAVNIGLEVFDKTGMPANSIASDEGVSLDVAVGATTTIATGATAVLTEDVIITTLSLISNGSARVVASTKTVACTAWLIDEVHSVLDPAMSTLPPPTGLNLPLIFVP